MNKKVTVKKTLCIVIFVSLVCSVVAWFCGMSFIKYQLCGDVGLYNKLNEINNCVKNNYIGTVDEQAVKDGVAYGYIFGVDDKYSKYYSASEWQKEKDASNGIINGIGVSVRLSDDGYLKVIEVYPDSPASSVGIEADDLIVKVNDVDIKGNTLEQAANLLTGEAGSHVKIVIRHNNEDVVKDLIRKAVDIPSIFSQMDEDIGYIKIKGFTASGAKHFEQEINSLKQKGAKAFIFDLRNNGGGTITSVCQMLNLLLPSGVIATQVTADGQSSILGMSDENELNLPMVTITNEETASASELFVCDLKDYNKAKQVGKTTYGKGVLQTTTPMSDGSAVKITTAYFNPAKSANFNDIGVVPDIEVGLSKEKEDLLLKNNLSLSDDEQYMAAVKLINESR